MRLPVLKNLLIQYKGGGYDGCFWEWNYFLFDADGNFHDIASSGYRAITTREAAVALIKEQASPKYRFTEGYYKYRLTSKKQIAEFQSECAATHVAGVVEKVNAIYGRNVMHWECDQCNRKQFDSEMYHDGYKGDGGIGVQMLGKLCNDCYTIGCCEYCGEYQSEPLKEIGCSYYCEYCAEQKQTA